MKSRFKVLSFMFVFLLLFGGVALAQNATSVLVEVSYPCDADQDECDTGEAVSRAGEGNGDKVNIYVTLLDAAGNPATAGPAGESLNTLTATVSSTLGTIQPNGFAADAQTVSFSGDAAARANIAYDDATPGTDQVIVSVSSDPDPLVGNAEVNVVAPPAARLVARTLRSSSPPQNIYDPIPEQQNNGDADEPAGFSVPVTIIADEGTGNPAAGLYTPDPALEGQQVMVKAYADYDEDGEAGGGVLGGDIAAGYEEDPIGTATLTMQNGIATGTVQINSAGPDGLDVVFTAEVDLGDDVIISTTLMGDPGVELDDFTVDTVTVNPLSADALLIGSDPYGNGNLIMEEECIAVLDDNATAVNTEIILVDSLGNAVNASSDVDFSGNFGAGSTLEDQLTFGCTPGTIVSGTYSDVCTVQDTNPAPAGTVVPGLLSLTNDDLATDSVPIQLVPGVGGVLDLQVTSDKAGDDIAAGDEVVLTLDCNNGEDCYLPVVNGDILEITATNLATGELQLLSSSDFASATTTLTIPASDEDGDLEGAQLPTITIYGPCSIDPDQNVQFTVTDTTRCDISADSDNINDIDPGEANKLAIVELADGVETESDLDDDGFEGTDPIVIDTPFIADGETVNPLLDEADSCDAQVWDEFDNVLDDEPDLLCSSSAGSGIVSVDACDVDVVYVAAAVGTTDTIICEVDIDGVDPRNFSIPNILAESVEPDDDEATAIVIAQEGPQTKDGLLISPCGEAIIRISANGTLNTPKNIEVFFGEGSDAGAELRALDSNAALPLPFPVTLDNGDDVKRFVVFAPTGGAVNTVGADLGSEPLDTGELQLPFCGDVECEVAVTCTATSLDCDECTTCTATTSGNGCQEPSYTWELNGAATTATTGSSVEICEVDTDGGSNTVTATDTVNIADGSATIDDVCDPIIGDCAIDVVQETVLRSRWSPTVALITIEGTDTEWVGGLIRDNFEITYSADVSRDLFWLPGTFPFLVEASQTIRQLIILLPAWFTSCCFDGSAETMTVEVCNTDTDCCDTDEVEITMLPLFLEQQ